MIEQISVIFEKYTRSKIRTDLEKRTQTVVVAVESIGQHTTEIADTVSVNDEIGDFIPSKCADTVLITDRPTKYSKTSAKPQTVTKDREAGA